MSRYSTRPFIDACRSLSIRNLIDLGCFRPEWKGKTIVYSQNEDGQAVPYLWCKPELGEDGTYHIDVTSGGTFFGRAIGPSYRIQLIELPAHFGGKRHQFVCPGEGCGRKVRTLYLVDDGVELLCRKCHRLRYQSSNRNYE